MYKISLKKQSKDTLPANKGFTLIELLVTVAIVGILAAIAIPRYNNYVRDAKIKSARMTLEQFPVLIEQYRAEKGRMCLPCNVTGVYNYKYSENATTGEVTGNLTKSTTNATPPYPDFRPRGTTSKPSPYDYSLRFNVTSCVNGTGCQESALFRAIPVPARGGSGDNINGTPYR